MPDRRRFAIGVTSLLALLGVAAAILLPSGAAPAAAQSAEPAVVCFEISVGWRICAASAVAPPPPPCRVVECIKPAPGAVERKIWAAGETMDEGEYFPILFWNVHTWVTEGYVPTRPTYYVDPWSVSSDHSWVLFVGVGSRETYGWIDGEPLALLHDRDTGRTWRWPGWHLEIRSLSDEYILFREHAEDEPSQPAIAHFALVQRPLDLVARFMAAIEDPLVETVWERVTRIALVAPDGGTVALVLATERAPDRVQLVDVATGNTTLFFEPEPREGYGKPRVGISEWRDGQQFAVTTSYSHLERKRPPIVHTKIFDWDGTELVDGSCPGQLSPDGRHVARQEGWAVAAKHSGALQPAQPWASVVIADAITCEPILRVRSAYASQNAWTARWLPSGEGFVVGVAPHPETGRDFALVRVDPSPELVDLPQAPVSPLYPPRRDGPWFAPVGGDRYFAQGSSGIYDARLGRWMRPVSSYWPTGWTSAGEVIYSWIYDPYEGALHWLLVQPKLEFPPFSEDLSLRVIGAGACVELRRADGDSACLADGTPVTYAGGERVTFSDEEFAGQDGGFTGNLNGLSLWVRTDGGSEGWIQVEHLAWR